MSELSRGGRPYQRILVDVSRTATGDHHTGIQRVVRTLYRALVAVGSERQLEVVPVLLTRHGPVPVRHFGRHPLEGEGSDLPGAPPLSDRARLALRGLADGARKALWARAEASPAARAVLGVCRAVFALGRGARALLQERILARPIGCGPADVLLLPDAAWYLDPWPAITKVKSAGGRVVAVWHDILPLQHPDLFEPTLPPLFKAYFDRLLQEADLLIPVSDATKQEVLAYAARSRLRAPPVESAWPSVSVPRPGARPLRPELVRLLQAPVVVMVATLEPRKGHLLLIEAAERLWETGAEFRLLLIGRLAWRSEAIRERLEMHRERNTRLFHFDDLSDGEVVRILQVARVAVLPSLAEGFGLPIIEAEAVGCPVVCTDIPVFREVASAGAVFFSPRTAVALADALAPFVGAAPAHPRPAPRPLPPPEDYARAVLAHMSVHCT